MNYKALLLSIMMSGFAYATQQHGQWITFETQGGGTFFDIANWYTNKASYTNGGLTFTFPEDLSLTGEVVVSATVEPASYSSSTNYSVQIESVSTTAVTIRVNNDSGEAASDDVIVHILVKGSIN